VAIVVVAAVGAGRADAAVAAGGGRADAAVVTMVWMGTASVSQGEVVLSSLMGWMQGRKAEKKEMYVKKWMLQS
jgi:hypothetical protein